MGENYSLNSRYIKQAATELINDNAINLITYIYRKAGILNKEDNVTMFGTAMGDDSKASVLDVIDEFANIPKDVSDATKESHKDMKDATKDMKDATTKDMKDMKDATKDVKGVVNKNIDNVFSDTEVRIGLSIRILAKTNKYHDEDLINLVLDDINYLRKNSDYLLSFRDPKARKAALDEEYALVQGFIDMDDTISLNQESETESKIGRLATDGQCVIF